MSSMTEERQVCKRLFDYLSSKLLNKSCITQLRSGDNVVVVVYQGSIDPGTIKSKYIPTVLSIMDLAFSMYKGDPKFKVTDVDIVGRKGNIVNLALWSGIYGIETEIEWFEFQIQVMTNIDRSDDAIWRGDEVRSYIEYYVPMEVVNHVNQQ